MEDLTEHWKPYRSIGGSRASHHIMRLQTYDTWEKGATICGLLQRPLRNKYVSCLSMNRHVFLSIHFGTERDWIEKASDHMRSSTKCGKGIFHPSDFGCSSLHILFDLAWFFPSSSPRFLAASKHFLSHLLSFPARFTKTFYHSTSCRLDVYLQQ